MPTTSSWKAALDAARMVGHHRQCVEWLGFSFAGVLAVNYEVVEQHLMATTALEKKYQRVRDEAVAYACEKFGVPSERVLVAFAEHDCIVDVYKLGASVTSRFVFYYEED